MQVCLSGHKITDMAASQPEASKPFCPSCGERTITACPICETAIQGYRHIPGVFHTAKTPVPNNCHGCGAAFPWRQTAIANAIEVLQMDLADGDAEQVPQLVEAVSKDTPMAEAAALKLKRLLPAAGKATYDIAVKVVSDVASETAKKTLGLK